MVHSAFVDNDLQVDASLPLMLAEIDEVVPTARGFLVSLAYVNRTGAVALYFLERESLPRLVALVDEPSTWCHADLVPVDDDRWLLVIDRTAQTREGPQESNDVLLVDSDGNTLSTPDSPMVGAWRRSSTLVRRVLVVPTLDGPMVVQIEHSQGSEDRWFEYSRRGQPPLERGHTPHAEPTVLMFGATRVALGGTAEGYDDEVATDSGPLRLQGTFPPFRERQHLPRAPIPFPKDGFAMPSNNTLHDGARYFVGTVSQQVPIAPPLPGPGQPFETRENDFRYESFDRLFWVRLPDPEDQEALAPTMLP